MKIAVFTDTYFPQVSGVATSVKILTEELEKQGHEVTIFTTTDPNVTTKEPENIVRIASIPFLFFTDRRVVIGGMNKAYQIAKEKQFDIVHTHTEFGMGLIGKYVAYRLKIPSVHTYHTMYDKYLHYIANGRIVKPNHVKALSAYFCNHTSGVISPGEQMTRILKSYAIEPPIVTIPTGVPIPKIEHSIRERMRQQLQLTTDQLVLLSLSRLGKEKSIDQLIAAIPEVLQKRSDAILVIVGDGPEKEALQQQVEQLQLQKNVIFVGEISNDDVYQYYQMADLYVNASTTETQGLTFLEALVNGLPIIAHKNDYLTQLISHESFGKLYEHTALIGQTILNYLPTLMVNKQLSTQTKETLLHEVSSQRFSQKIVDFYLDAITAYQTKRTNQNNPKSYLNRKYFTRWFNQDDDDKI